MRLRSGQRHVFMNFWVIYERPGYQQQRSQLSTEMSIDVEYESLVPLS